jgi:hypothetical protein
VNGLVDPIEGLAQDVRILEHLARQRGVTAAQEILESELATVHPEPPGAVVQ